MTKIKTLLIITLFVCMISGCGKGNGSDVSANSISGDDVSGDNEGNGIFEREYNDSGQVRSFLTGEFVDAKIGERRPVAIMISNIKAAQPMCGISKADVVYECQVEGELTRFMGIFEDYDDLDKIGSTRSCRDYFVYWALEFDSVYTHFGQSSYAVEVLERDYVDNLSGLASIGSTVFYRTDDRVSPHNAYASAKGIQAGIKKMGFRTEYEDTYSGKFNFAQDGEIVSLEEKGGTRIEPGYFVNKPWFEYNSKDKKYYRFQYGGPQIDELTGEQLAYTNVILQYADWCQRDEKGYLAFDCHTDGYALIFTNGTFQESHWYREGDVETGVIRYYNIGLTEEIKLNQGKTMVCVVKETIDDEVNPYVKFQ